MWQGGVTAVRVTCSVQEFSLPLAEKVLVHEWGHLRWGLFDEYPIGEDITEHFYQSPTTNTIEPSRCNINVVGRMRHSETGADCKLDPATSLPESKCRFYANRAQTKALSSFMYYHFLPSVRILLHTICICICNNSSQVC